LKLIAELLECPGLRRQPMQPYQAIIICEVLNQRREFNGRALSKSGVQNLVFLFPAKLLDLLYNPSS
jgi:hypothetical protein